jgi:hypothetical protein
MKAKAYWASDYMLKPRVMGIFKRNMMGEFHEAVSGLWRAGLVFEKD